MPSGQRTSVKFTVPAGAKITWLGPTGYIEPGLVAPASYNFLQGNVYRLRVSGIPNRAGKVYYPTLELANATQKTLEFLSHNTVPIGLTDDDLERVNGGNFVTKVIYLPDPEFQELALAGVDTLVSTRLDPGVDPITEADRRGAILAIIRLGNKDLELPGSNDGTAGMGADGGVLPCAMDGACPPNYVAGVTAPMYGMPMSGTPIGLPGPPHIPLGGPAGLQKHVMVNRTHMNIPQPTSKFKINVRQQPGYSYPKPANRVRIREQSIQPSLPFGQPHYDRHERIGTPNVQGGVQGGEYCPPGQQ